VRRKINQPALETGATKTENGIDNNAELQRPDAKFSKPMTEFAQVRENDTSKSWRLNRNSLGEH
jgi:hypothetical protein